MHIVYISIESPYDEKRGGGIASYLRAIIPAMLAQGHQVTLISHASQPPTNLPSNNNLRVKHIRLPNIHWVLSKTGKIADPLLLPVRQIEWSAAFYLAARRILQKHPADVIETAETGALFFALHEPQKLVVRLHGCDYVFRKFTGQSLSIGTKLNFWLEKQSIMRAWLVTSPSQFQSRQMEVLLGWRTYRIQIIPNPLAEPYFNPISNFKKSRRPIILYSGRLASVKGTEILLKAIPLLKQKYPRILIILAGDLQMTGLKLNHDARLGLREGFLWLGHQNQTEMMKWYQRASVLAIPSLYETFGLAALEAMACSLPVVASRVGALPEIIQDGQTGILVQSGDEKALVDGILKILMDEKLAAKLIKNGQEKIKEYNSQQVAKNMVQSFLGIKLI